MAINPNTNFVAGAVLLASEQNRFPRGIMQIASNATTDAAITVDKSVVTATFTAVANRNYRLIYTEPQLGGSVVSYYVMSLRVGATFATSALIANTVVGIPVAAINTQGIIQAISTFTAGTNIVYAAIQINVGTGTATRSGFKKALLTVEDMGPA
tara:strand:+ start:357 stop:821 length:465 start_codon:yes stop_codon:yes gene_type:complete